METMDLAREQNGIIYSETIETTAYSGALSQFYEICALLERHVVLEEFNTELQNQTLQNTVRFQRCKNKLRILLPQRTNDLYYMDLVLALDLVHT